MILSLMRLRRRIPSSRSRSWYQELIIVHIWISGHVPVSTATLPLMWMTVSSISPCGSLIWKCSKTESSWSSPVSGMRRSLKRNSTGLTSTHWIWQRWNSWMSVRHLPIPMPWFILQHLFQMPRISSAMVSVRIWWWTPVMSSSLQRASRLKKL